MRKEIKTLQSGAYELRTVNAVYTIFLKKGKQGKGHMLGNLRITNIDEESKTTRFDINLFDSISIKKKVELVEGDVDVKSEILYQEVNQFSLLLEDELNTNTDKKNPSDYIQDEKSAMNFLRGKNLVKEIDKVLSLTIAGEGQNRLLLFFIAISYKSNNLLQAICIAKSGAGKSYLIKAITALLPSEDLLSLLVLSKSSIPNMGQGELVNKCVVLEDMIHLTNDVWQHIREAQTNGSIGVSKYSHEFGRTITHKVESHFSTLGAITSDVKIPVDNKNRSFLIDLDNSEEQTNDILDIQSKVFSGDISDENLSEEKAIIQDAIRLLKPVQVVNPFANQLTIPDDCMDKPRLQSLFLGLINTITFSHQYQREMDEQGRVISTIEDVELAIDLSFKMFLTKSDNFSVLLRSFFEELKEYLETQQLEGQSITDVVFKRNEIIDNLDGSKTTIYEKFGQLVKIGVITSVGGNKKVGEKFQLTYDDEYQARKERIKEQLYSFNQNHNPSK